MLMIMSDVPMAFASNANYNTRPKKKGGCAQTSKGHISILLSIRQPS